MTDETQDHVTDDDVNDAIGTGADDDIIGGESGQPAGQAQTGAPAQDTVDDLITDEEYQRLESNPAELRRLARERYNERLSQHSDVIGFKKAYDEDPVKTVTNLARRLGIIKDEQPPAQNRQDPAQPTIEQIVHARFSKVLGPQLAAEMTPIILEVSRAMAEQAVGPIQQNLRQTSEAAQKAEASRIVSSYFEKNPDAVAHQEGMFQLMEKYPPGKGVSDEEWLDLLHREAARIAGKGQVTSARKVAASLIKTTVQQIRGSSPASVTTKIPKEASGKAGNQSEARRLAFEAATRGERWDE